MIINRVDERYPVGAIVHNAACGCGYGYDARLCSRVGYQGGWQLLARCLYCWHIVPIPTERPQSVRMCRHSLQCMRWHMDRREISAYKSELKRWLLNHSIAYDRDKLKVEEYFV